MRVDWYDGELISQREAAAQLGVSLSTVERLIANGVLMTVPLGRRVYVAQVTVETEAARRVERQDAGLGVRGVRLEEESGVQVFGFSGVQATAEGRGRPGDWEDDWYRRPRGGRESGAGGRGAAEPPVAEAGRARGPVLPVGEIGRARRPVLPVGERSASDAEAADTHLAPQTPPPTFPHPTPQTPNLMTTAEAAARLGVSGKRVQQFVKEGKLHPVPTVNRFWCFAAGEVEALAMMRKARKARERPGESLTWWGDRSKPPPPEWEGTLMSVAEAAEALGMSKHRVRELVWLGRMPGLQAKPGRQGSRLMIPAHYVRSLVRHEDYRERRERYDRSVGQPRKLHPAWERWGLEAYDPCEAGPSTWKERAGLYTTRQAALRLGVTPSQVLRLRKQGVLHGWRRPEPEGGWRIGSESRWWYFERPEVEYRRMARMDARRRTARRRVTAADGG